MSDPTQTRPPRPDRLTDIRRLADDVRDGLRKLDEFQQECASKCREMLKRFEEVQAQQAREFHEIEWNLIELVTRLKDRVHDLTLPEAVDEEPEAVPPGVPEAESAAPPTPSDAGGAATETPADTPAAEGDAEHPRGAPLQTPQRSEVAQDQPAVPAKKEEPPPASPSLKEAVKRKYPAYTRLETVGVQATKLMQAPGNVPLPRTALEAITTAFPRLGKKLSGFLEGDGDEGRAALGQQGRELLNRLQELDDALESSQLSPEQGQALRGIRDGLWAFIETATEKEYRVIELHSGVNVNAGIRLGNYQPEEKYIEFQRVNTSRFAKDVVVRTVRPGYVKMTADRKQPDQVIRKARVQIASGSAY